MAERNIEETSKYLAMLLRHSSEQARLDMDTQGWVLVDQLVANVPRLSKQILLGMITAPGKSRFELSEDHTRVRARHGHSTKQVAINYEEALPPAVLFHGTAMRFLASINSEGLRGMKRHHVQMTTDRDEAFARGLVWVKDAQHVRVLEIDTAAMKADGVHLFRSTTSGTWLARHVPTKYLRLNHRPLSEHFGMHQK